MTNPLVSVITITYNHAPYIRRCIEGVLMQITDFPFEMVIGEDCSTDGTREIVFEYAEKYPEIIRVITSDANVGGQRNIERTFKASQGEYIAFCEGDDYWIDPMKLQKQYDAINKFDAVLITHNTIVLNFQGQVINEIRLRLKRDESGYIKTEDIILKVDNFHTSSYFVRRGIFKKPPDWYYNAPIGDVPLRLFAAMMGKIYYINEIMSVYQHGTPGSWTDRERKSAKGDQRLSKFIRDYLVMYRDFDRFSEYRYHQVVKERSVIFLAKHIFERGNQEYLDIPANRKYLINTIVFLSHYIPGELKTKVQKKIANYLVNSIYV